MVRPSKPPVSTHLIAIAFAFTGIVLVASSVTLGTSLVGDLSQFDSDAVTAATPTAERTDSGYSATPSPDPGGASTTVSRPTTSSSESERARRYSYAAREGANETAIQVYDSGRPGPTVIVVGGQHGNEPAGFLAAGDIADWRVERGVLVVVPEANPRGVRDGTRKVDGRDLNAQFPVGERPASAQAHAVWGVIVRHDADVVVDLHSSEGVYGVDGGVGQAVFPTVTGDAVSYADTAIERTNREYALQGNRSFRRGNTLGRSGRSLTRKVAGDLNETAYVVETTKRNTDRQSRVEWTKAITWELLRLHGLVSGEPPRSR